MSNFELLLRLYPQRFQSRFAPEILATHREALAEQRLLGYFAHRSFLVRELAGAILGASCEWAAVWRIAGQKMLQSSGEIVHVITAVYLALASGAILFAFVLPIGPVAAALERPFFERIAVYCLLSAAAIEVAAALFQRAAGWEER